MIYFEAGMMLRAILTFFVVALALFVLLSALGGFAGPIELAVVLLAALAAAVLLRRAQAR